MTTDTDAVMASAIAVVGTNGQVLRRVKLLPYGTFRGRDGRGPWVLDGKAHAEQVIAATRQFQGNADMMFDYDHQSALAAVPGVGGTAKASGWIKLDSLAAEDDGIYANVDWTQAAEAALKSREYRYHSPYFRAAKGTGRVTRLVNAGLTNSPNLDLPVLASFSHDARVIPSIDAMGDTLTDAERVVCSSMGIAEADWVAERKREALDQAHRAHVSAQLTEDERIVCSKVGMDEAVFLDAKMREARLKGSGM